MEYLGEIEDYMDALEVAPEDVQPSNKKVIKKGPNQPQLDFKPEYYGLKINECDLTKHDILILEIIKLFGFTTWVVGRDDALGQKGIPHFHIHFKSEKKLDALRKQKQKVLPQWGHSCKLYTPRKNASDWYCWAGYAIKEMEVGMSSDITDEEKIEIRKHAHTQAVIKKSKLKWAQKEDDKKQEKKDLETRLYELLDKEFLKLPSVDSETVADRFGEHYFNDVGEMPPATTSKSKIWKWLYTRKFVSMRTYMHNTTDFRYLGEVHRIQ